MKKTYRYIFIILLAIVTLIGLIQKSLDFNAKVEETLQNSRIGWIVVSYSEEGGNNDLYLLSPDGTEIIKFGLDELNPEEPSWSHDWQRIVFISEGNIFVVKAVCVDLEDGCTSYVSAITTNLSMEIPDGYFLTPVFSFDGNEVGFSYRQTKEIDEFSYRCGRITLTDGNLYLYESPAWQPGWLDADNNLACLFYRRDSTFLMDNLVLMNKNNQVPDILFEEDIYQEWVWAPNREKILYLSGSPPEVGMYISNIDGNEIIHINQALGPIWTGGWSPDGESIAVASYDGIYIISLDTMESTLIFPRVVYDLAWNP